MSNLIFIAIAFSVHHCGKYHIIWIDSRRVEPDPIQVTITNPKSPHANGKLSKVSGAGVFHPLDVASHITTGHTRQVIALDFDRATKHEYVYIWALLWLHMDLSNHLKGQMGPPVSDVTFLHIFRAAKCPVNRLSLTTIAKFTENTPLYPLQLSLARKWKRRSGPVSSLRTNRLSSWAWLIKFVISWVSKNMILGVEQCPVP